MCAAQSILDSPPFAARPRLPRMTEQEFVEWRRQIRKYQLEGPADLIIEVVSPWTQSVDRRDKFFGYQAAGVKEYWIVDPQSQTIEVYALGKNRRYGLIEDESGVVRSKVLPGFYVRAPWLWREPFPRVSALVREMIRKRRRS